MSKMMSMRTSADGRGRELIKDVQNVPRISGRKLLQKLTQVVDRDSNVQVGLNVVEQVLQAEDRAVSARGAGFLRGSAIQHRKNGIGKSD